MERDNLNHLIADKITAGYTLMEQLNVLLHVEGIKKMQRKIRQEIRFLQKAINSGKLKVDYVHCSNINYFSAIVQCILQESNVTQVDYPVVSEARKIHIDVICDNGSTWIKVVARNKKSLTEAVLGQTSHSVRTILDKADDYILAAKMHPNFFKPPQVIFEFTTGIDDFLREALELKGVIVRIQKPYIGKSNTSCDKELLHCVETLNLDVTTLLAYISNLSNGYCCEDFKEPILREQAKWERQRPINDVLNKLFTGRKLICCETARNAFENIVKLIGGPNEKMRAIKLLERVTVLPDMDVTQHQEINNLRIGGRIKQRSKIIFEFGQRLRAITVTANEGFVRAAKQQEVEFAVFVHEARALTEMKENNNNCAG